MTTIKQIEANRRNSQNSTGPRTETGKAATRLNALKTGIDAETQILRGESPEAFAALSAEYYEFYRPTTPDQRIQLDIAITSEWLLRRFRRVEHEMWDAELVAMAKNDYADKERPYAQAFKFREETFLRLQRRINSTQRQLQAALAILRKLLTTGPAAAETAPPSPELLRVQPVTPGIGLVPQLGRARAIDAPPTPPPGSPAPETPGSTT